MLTPTPVTRRQFLEEWVNDLTSGKYPQGRGALARVNIETHVLEYCCLGVACETGVRLGLLSRRETEGEDRDVVFYGVAGSDEWATGALPAALAAFFEDTEAVDPDNTEWDGAMRYAANPRIPEHPLTPRHDDIHPTRMRFAVANDARLLTFDEFALIIRETWLAVEG